MRGSPGLTAYQPCLSKHLQLRNHQNPAYVQLRPFSLLRAIQNHTKLMTTPFCPALTLWQPPQGP